MGFSGYYALPLPVELSCQGCQPPFKMQPMDCGMVYSVTPCHASDPDRIQAAGGDY